MKSSQLSDDGRPRKRTHDCQNSTASIVLKASLVHKEAIFISRVNATWFYLLPNQISLLNPFAAIPLDICFRFLRPIQNYRYHCQFSLFKILWSAHVNSILTLIKTDLGYRRTNCVRLELYCDTGL